jgi:hypothetical protein
MSWKLSCPVLRGGESGDARTLPDVFDLRDGDTKTVRNLLAYRKVGVEGQTKPRWC